MSPTWKRLGTGREHDFRILRIREDRVLNPRNGTEHPVALVDCVDWVNVIPVTRDGQLIFIRQFRFGTWADSLEIPGGMLEAGESPEQAAARELEEETGYRPGRLELLGFVHPNPAVQTNRCHMFRALDCEQVHGGRQDAGEDVSVELYGRQDLPRLLKEEVTHALVLAAFLFERMKDERR